ncbi:MAG: FtsQ-type POTRA domain-containing protein [Eggerthellaceae bacterium]|nr:FtsQ-type POTRA domain-containing protein [Eggerthellaceae bacterium]
MPQPASGRARQAGARTTASRAGLSSRPSAGSRAGAASARSPRGANVTSVRIGDIDRREREARAKQKRAAARRPLIVVGTVAALAVALVIVYAVLARSSVFAIENIEVQGADHLTTAEVSQLFSVPQGTTLLSVDTGQIESSLLRDAWVESVTVKRAFPSTLQVVITERDVAAVVEVAVGQTQTIQNWAIASDGMWLMAIPSQDSEIGKSLSPKIYEDAEAALHITGVPYGLEPEIGSYCSDSNVNNALSIVDGMTTDLAGQVKKVTATDAESTLLTLENGIEIAFGTADNIRDKERVCLQIMQDNPTVVYINVRVVDRPTWRAA